ncbi:ribose phosphate diphosphokinase subunit PRS1 [Ascoidea rubescens DSM 1968]|uniref:Ribose-phosphate pyrophosphokinase 1 n=1 Tax=Ascoidea rubescens DSM 1968 TaxID=1344418 RepID=A0A1D2V9T4_9ASCO|nr:phosphoribosyl pyrophosphokinase [Ascoidea rubescens DSM 1968]ODV58394.1 phosphoribosyl pyrophosphokinase [Ascoidea rubescens DSM 1968]
MRKCKIFVGNSHPELGQLICQRLGTQPASCTLKKFSNGETSVQIGVSVRDEDVYIIQSGSNQINDHIMELLILINACKGGSANKITAVIPQFPYAKQSKMKKHRGAITARMFANLLIMAGADHVVSMDLHAGQMQGFFSKPVDNLYGAPTLARWIKQNIDDFQNAVVVSKNPGGTKRVTALADSLKIRFAMIHTDRRRSQDIYLQKQKQLELKKKKLLEKKRRQSSEIDGDQQEYDNIILTNELQTARVIQGHVVDDDYPSIENSDTESNYTSISQPSSLLLDQNNQGSYALGGTVDASMNSDDDDDEAINIKQEKLITLVGDVSNRVAILLDDMIDKPTSFIAAAEHLRMNCGAKKCYVVATHGIFLDDCLPKLESCKYIDRVVVTNTYPISLEQRAKNKKLTVIDVSAIFAECIRRDHYGESISVLFDSLVAL